MNKVSVFFWGMTFGVIVVKVGLVLGFLVA